MSDTALANQGDRTQIRIDIGITRVRDELSAKRNRFEFSKYFKWKSIPGSSDKSRR